MLGLLCRNVSCHHLLNFIAAFVPCMQVSALGFLLLSALYISSISSCLATLYGTPRVLQSIASENVIPAMAKLADGVSESVSRFTEMVYKEDHRLRESRLLSPSGSRMRVHAT